jgi:hypothetical protein
LPFWALFLAKTDFQKLCKEAAMSHWRDLYAATVLETNRKRLEGMVCELEVAICGRLRNLDKFPEPRGERQELANASAVLLTLKAERLGWPDPAKPLRGNAKNIKCRYEPSALAGAEPMRALETHFADPVM